MRSYFKKIASSIDFSKVKLKMSTTPLLKEVPYIDLSSSDDEVENSQKRRDSGSSWKNFFIDSLNKHPKEREFLHKLDFFLLSSSMLGYFIKTLNQSNISVAYINGMNEHYHMDKNQYNYLISFWTVGYVLGQIPSSMAMTKFSARYYLGILQLTWGVLSILQIYCTSLSSLYILRFIVGVSESAYFPGIQYILGSYYSSTEIAKRSTLFSVSSSLAGVLSPIIQEVILFRWKSSTGETTNLQPFQYMFVIDGLITFPIALYTMLVIPNTPTTMDSFYFSEQDRLVALERRRRDSIDSGSKFNRSSQGSKTISYSQIVSYCSTWHIWVFPLMFLAFNNSTSCHGQPTLQTWMKYDLQLPSSSYNVIPSIISSVGIIAAISVSFIGDYFGKGRLNYLFVSIFFSCTLVGCALLAYWDIPYYLHWACYVLITVPSSWCQPQIFSWLNRLLAGEDDLKRNFIVVITNTLAYVTGAWVPILVWDTRSQPRYFVGFTYTACLSIVGLIMTTQCKRFEERDKKIREEYDNEES
ncbi:vitamin H transporter [[Candida] railenensis]|uniref:Vitamin H transporter n=1 Tax=[Candida] railenensis TaxID=45579 RepID=A0A9P0VZ86_9ASCO|nr:vitamin H transporter [[Candida] railenensis]